MYTLAERTTGEFAVVLKPATDKMSSKRPLVKVMAAMNGEPVDNGPELDLNEKDDPGNYYHRIVRLIDDTEHWFDTRRYFS